MRLYLAVPENSSVLNEIQTSGKFEEWWIGETNSKYVPKRKQAFCIPLYYLSTFPEYYYYNGVSRYEDWLFFGFTVSFDDVKKEKKREKRNEGRRGERRRKDNVINDIIKGNRFSGCASETRNCSVLAVVSLPYSIFPVYKKEKRRKKGEKKNNNNNN